MSEKEQVIVLFRGFYSFALTIKLNRLLKLGIASEITQAIIHRIRAIPTQLPDESRFRFCI